MTMKNQSIKFMLAGILATVLVVAGCATSWNKRIGKVTYEQAVVELGTPSKTTALSDGGRKAIWDQNSSHISATPLGGGTTRTGTERAWRVLEFGPDGILMTADYKTEIDWHQPVPKDWQ
jgi:hypothetical protein